MGGIGDIVLGDDDDDEGGGVGIDLAFAVLMVAYAPNGWRFFYCHLRSMAALAELLPFCCYCCCCFGVVVFLIVITRSLSMAP